MTAQFDNWPIERIRSLSKPEVHNLRQNALCLGHDVVVERCDQILNAVPASRSGSRLKKRIAMIIPSTAAEEIAELFVNLPPVAAVPNAHARLRRLADPVKTFSELWRQYINCGFSSQEKSDPDTPLGRFAEGESPLMHLPSVIANGENPDWIAAELAAAGLNRMTGKKRDLVLAARRAFVKARGLDDLLVNGRSGGGLSVFLDLARGLTNDHEIATSARFSRGLDAEELYGISHKQIRNILVNTGLAHNVIPLDSRWKGYIGNRMHFDPADLGRRNAYLEVEDVIRKALMIAQNHRNDIPNLAVLDSVVFAVQSSKGHIGGGWTGA